MKIIDLSIRNSLLLNLLTAVLLLSGIYTMLKMRREAFPSVDFDTVMVTTVYPGASASEVEQYVTNRVEEKLQAISNIEEITSTSRENSSLIVLKLYPDLSDRDKISTIQSIREAVDQVQGLPESVTEAPRVKEITSGDMPVMELALSSNKSYEVLHDHVDRLIDAIENLGDASDVIKYGFLDKEYWIEVDPKRLREHHVSLAEIIGALKAQNINLPGGTLSSPSGDYLVRTVGELKTIDSMRQVILRSNSSGVVLRIGDVAEVRKTFAEATRLYQVNGRPSINLIVRKKPSGDIVTLVAKVKQLVAAYRQNLPEDELEAAFVNDISVFVQNRLGVLVNNGVVGVFLVLLSLLLFLSRGIALVTAVGMPVALIGAMVVMNLLGMTINLITLFALVIVLGMLVDDAIIVAENIWQHYELGKSPYEAVRDGTKEVFWPVTATILTTIAAFSPLLLVSGIFGKFISSLPKVVIVCLLLSLVEAMIILPSHAYDVLRWNSFRGRKGVQKVADQKGFMVTMVGLYGGMLNKILRFRYLVLVLFMGVLGGSVYFALNHMRLILFPTEGIESFYVQTELPLGTSLAKTNDKISAFEQHIRKQIAPEILKDTVTYVGAHQIDALDPFTARASHLAQVAVYLTPQIERQATVQETIATLRASVLEEAKRTGFGRTVFVLQRIGPPVGKPVAVRLYSKDLTTLELASERIKTELAAYAGVSDITDSLVTGKEEFQIALRQPEAKRALLTAADVATHVRGVLEGQIASYVYQDGDRIPMRVRYAANERTSIAEIAESQLSNPRGNLITLKDVTDISSSSSISAISHRDARRYVTVAANIDESITTSTLVNQSLEKYIDSLKSDFPLLRLETGGEYEDTNKSMESLFNAFAVALALIFVILATQFRSMTQPLVVMAAIPFGVIGVVIAFYAHDLPLSFLGMIGVIGLSGVVVNDSIVLVDFINKDRDRGTPLLEAVVTAGKRRFRAVWLTSITTVFGLLPLAYGLGGADLFLQPAAMALGYGLLFATVLILLLVPVFYIIRIDVLSFLQRWLLAPIVKGLFKTELSKIR